HPMDSRSAAQDAVGEYPGVAALREVLRRTVAESLEPQLRAQGQARGKPLDPAERCGVARSLLTKAADAYAAEQLGRPGSPCLVPDDVEVRVIEGVLDEVFGLAGLAPLLGNTEIENININGCDRVFVRYADGHRERLGPVATSDVELIELIRDLAARSGVEERRFDRGAPIANFSLPGGERASAVMALTARPSLSIRRHRFTRVTLAELREKGTFDRGLESFLSAMVRARKNVLVTGGAAVGKTTLLRALAAAIPPWERLVTIEDVFELGLEAQHPDVVALQAREANVEGAGRVTQSDLVWQSLRMSPDRVIVGEVRGPEVIPLTNAMSMGNDGSMGTVHCSTSAGIFPKLAAYAVQGAERLSLEATNLLVSSAVHFVVHLARPRGDDASRVVSSVREVIGADGPMVVSNEVWRPGNDLRAVPGAPLRAETTAELATAGFDPDLLVAPPEGWWQS
ncbi:MAG: CpaF family protein, partial [Pseudonocardiaceae bacterium]